MEIDDLLSEILLRLPPEPSSLPRASLVSKRWRGLSRDPAFLRRFRARHRSHAPLLGGFFTDYPTPAHRNNFVSFVPTLDAPNRVRFPFPVADFPCILFSCRHGLVLAASEHRQGFLVWDPVTGDQHRLEEPPGLDAMNGAVLRTGEGHFRVVLVGHDEHHTQALACVYSSQTRQWGGVISAPIPPVVSIVTEIPGVLVGDSIYWLSSRNPDHPTPILEFNLGTLSLAAIQLPVNMYGQGNHSLWVMRAQDDGLGFLFLWGTDAQLWKRTKNGGDDAANSWTIAKTIQMDKLLSLNTEEEKRSLSIEGLVEDRNVVFFRTAIGHFMVHLESLWSLRCKELSETHIIHVFHPFSSVYTAADNSTSS
ncbi:hypothetical protein VPH35_113913 [Triticum aestivum]